MKLDAVLYALGSKSAISLHPFLPDTHCQYFRQTTASRVQTLCMHANKCINRPTIPMPNTHKCLLVGWLLQHALSPPRPFVFYCFAILVMNFAAQIYLLQWSKYIFFPSLLKMVNFCYAPRFWSIKKNASGFLNNIALF